MPPAHRRSPGIIIGGRGSAGGGELGFAGGIFRPFGLLGSPARFIASENNKTAFNKTPATIMHPKCLFLPCPQDGILKEAAELRFPGSSRCPAPSRWRRWDGILLVVVSIPELPPRPGEREQSKSPSQRRQPSVGDLLQLSSLRLHLSASCLARRLRAERSRCCGFTAIQGNEGDAHGKRGTPPASTPLGSSGTSERPWCVLRAGTGRLLRWPTPISSDGAQRPAKSFRWPPAASSSHQRF